MRVGERHADGLAAVLEREHLLDPGQRLQRGGRSAHASITVRARVWARPPNDPSCSGLKHTTSQRPTDVRDAAEAEGREIVDARGGSDAAGAPSCASVSAGPNEGDLFSKTATS